MRTIVKSNVVALGGLAELSRAPIQLAAVDGRMQRAVIAWADQIGVDFGGCVLRLVERPALVNEASVVYEWAGDGFAARFVGNAVSAVQRSLADRLSAEKPQLKPTARRHDLATGGEVRVLRSLILPFGPLLVVQLADGDGP